MPQRRGAMTGEAGVACGVTGVTWGAAAGTKRTSFWRGAVGVAPDSERGVTGIAAGRRETIGEAGVGWRRRTESMIGFCLRTTLAYIAFAPRGFKPRVP